MSQNQFDQSNNNKVEGSSRLEIQKRLQERLKSRTDTTSRSTPRTFQQLPDYLKQVLPDNYTYIIKSYKEIELETFAGAPTAAFDSTFYINISSIEAIEQWKAAFHAKTGTIFRITRADKVKGIKVIYHKDFHCRHADIAAIKYMQKTYAQKVGQRRNRNTNCQCLAKIRLEKSQSGGDIDLNSTNNIMLTNIPNTPSNASTSSDESGSNTPQCNLEFEFESRSSSIRQTALKRSASEYFPDQHQLHGSSSLKRRSTTTGAGRTNYNNN
ncbi:15698_t:CDS:2 [Entrophospora sp. SA101]|nr:543_t:CDS:2 [Entrophospora sp. SA101]CAJ0631602.1 6958_t:CDS:2 [Entrophospora sp. SA101]CAJ0745191.1 14794_t:CDS:2 [Entrophospora sp. SA101]CAJ0745993.1 15698_t:CDS:2 [Entrophospora sp. SA101]CAJ0823913.1 16508_t:CDS:2 [Entrophospora sp. SA101]